jgi:endonuclease YncB( thermonuclease family)
MRVAPQLCFLVIPILTPLAAAAATLMSFGDGDTLPVEEAGKKITIHIACIDAPEIVHFPYGQKGHGGSGGRCTPLGPSSHPFIEI